jgi:hypothetical protein
LFLGAYNNVSILDSDTGESWRVTYSFTVTPVDAQARIAAASLESPRLWTQNAVLPAGGVITLSATPRGGSTSLGSLQLRSQLGPLDGATTAMFAPQQSITINGTARLFGAARFENVVHSFRVIPEPTAGGLASFGCALAFLGRTRRQPCEKLGQCRLSMPETRRTR